MVLVLKSLFLNIISEILLALFLQGREAVRLQCGCTKRKQPSIYYQKMYSY